MERPSLNPNRPETNRRVSRLHERTNRSKIELQSRLEQTRSLLGASARKWHSVHQQFELNVPKIIFEGEPFIYDLLSYNKEFASLISRAALYNFEFSDGALTDFYNRDLFSREVSGTSLSDIENMPLPLSLENIKRINKMFKASIFTKRDKNQLLVIYSMIYFAAQKLARPDLNIGIDKRLQPLYDRLTDYFDYYTDLMTDFSLEPDKNLKFYRALRDGYPGIFVGLGSYLPARFGITPASAIKIYHQHGDNSYMSFFYKGVLSRLEAYAKDAINKNGLPDDLLPFALYDPQKDKRATQLLLEFYQGRNNDQSAQMDVYDEYEKYINRLAIYQKLLHSDIVSSIDRRLEITFPEKSVADKLTLTSQNRRTLIFILHFKNAPTHLTFEIDRMGTFYGIPPKLINDYPHIAYTLLVDALGPVLEKAKKDHPRQEISSIVEVSKAQEEQVIETPRTPQKPAYVPRPREKKTEKPRATSSIISQFLSARATLPDRQHQPQKKFVVLHSKSAVRELMGRKPREKDLERIMRAIRNYEYGHAESKTIDWSGGHVQSLRVGDYRIILRNLRGRFYSVDAVGHRNKDVYRDYADTRV